MSHGGAAPQVRRKAEERLMKGVPKMLSELSRLASDDSIPPNVRLAAVRDWLDRAGVGEPTKFGVEVGLRPWEQILTDAVEGVVVDYGRYEGEISESETVSGTADSPTRRPSPFGNSGRALPRKEGA